jgi:hypothetical protein
MPGQRKERVVSTLVCGAQRLSQHGPGQGAAPGSLTADRRAHLIRDARPGQLREQLALNRGDRLGEGADRRDGTVTFGGRRAQHADAHGRAECLGGAGEVVDAIGREFGEGGRGALLPE